MSDNNNLSKEKLEDNLNALTDYFKNASHQYESVGLVVEHIVVYSDTKEAVPYYGDFGITYILKELSAFYPDVKISLKDPILSFTTERFKFTLGPAAQIEINIFPREEISSLKRTYDTFREYLDEVLIPFGYECLTVGYQPTSLASDIEIIPDKYYNFIDRYFKTTGTHGVNLMRGTASTKVSIDYSNETDFRRKIQAAYFLSPLLKLIADNSPYFEGHENNMHLLRYMLFDNVDNKRCGIIPGVFSPTFGYKDYAKYILSIPNIYIPENITGSEPIYTGDVPAYQTLGNTPIDSHWIEHITSMAFPDVRVKSNIEICTADSLPGNKLFAYVALIKGLLYNEQFLDYTADFIKTNSLSEKDITKANENLSEHGWNGIFYNISAIAANNKLVEQAKSTLSREETSLLNVLMI